MLAGVIPKLIFFPAINSYFPPPIIRTAFSELCRFVAFACFVIVYLIDGDEINRTWSNCLTDELGKFGSHNITLINGPNS